MRLARAAALSIVALAAASSRADDEPEIGPEVDAGDPTAVPVIQRWLARLADRSLADDPAALGELLNACRAASMYELDEAGPAMVRAYRAIPRAAASWMPDLVRTAARYRTADARTFQWTLLRDPRVADDFLRVTLLSTLAEGGDDGAVEAIGRFIERDLRGIAARRGASGELTSIVPLTRSPALIARVARIEPPTDAAAARALADVRDRLAQNGATPAALMDAIEHASKAEVRRVGDALLTLGRVGELEDVGRLATLALGADDALANNDRLIAWRDDAVASIRRRRWREAATQPTTRGGER